MARSIHPTKEKLISTMVELMDEHSLSTIQVDDVLRESNISKGSLYHHFENFEALVESALIARFAASVDMSIVLVGDAVHGARTAEEFVEKIIYVTTATQGPERAKFRMERARVIGLSVNSPNLLEALQKEQDRLTAAMTDIVREGQEKGWVSKTYDAKTMAVFMQAYTIGRVIDDVASEGEHIDSQDWNDVVNAAVKSLLSI
ncbi:MAG: TetR/AcrR family transcriptional regulator [Micrococcales bacterium]